jgi:hypothetical protein
MATMIRRMAMAGLSSALLLAAAACGKKAGDQPADGSGSAAVKADGKPDPDGKDLAATADPAGVSWRRADVPFGSLELPSGPGWNITDVTQAEGPDGVVIMMQSQDGIAPDQVDDYLASYDEAQQRDAPRYERKSQVKGTVAGQPAARVEGTFDNGTKFVTRDFLIFTKGKVVLLGSRIPEQDAAKLPALIDHIARSLQAK